MSTMGGVCRRDVRDLVKAVIEEAWRRARRRRLIYGAVVLSLATIGVLSFVTLRGPSTSASGAPALLAGPSTPVVRVLADESVYHGHGEFDLDGKRGGLHLSLRFGTGRSWKLGPGVGQYREIRGSGKGLPSGRSRESVARKSERIRHHSRWIEATGHHSAKRSPGRDLCPHSEIKRSPEEGLRHAKL